MSLRWRLTAYYTGISVGLLLLGSLVLFLLLRTTLRQTLDDSLREAVALAASQLEHDKPRTAGTAELFLTRLPGATVLLIYSSQGVLIESYGVPPVRPAPVPGFRTVGSTRIYGEILADGSVIQAMRSEVEISRSIGRAQRLLLLTLPLLLLMGLGAGYTLADRALRPVDQVTRLAAQIAASGRYGQRVPESPGKDEMARLTRTFNAMLARLERSIEREKAFAVAAAHELRTPLSLLQGRASLSLERPRSPEQYREALAEIACTAEDLAQVIEALLLLARTQSPFEPEPVELDLLALEAQESLEGLAKERQVRMVLQLEPALCQGHPLTLRTAIANLLANAIKYGPLGGRVWLRTRREGRLAMVEVADEGPGIPPEQLERLLQPFQRGASTQGVRGAGLGLTLVMAVAEQHGGRLRLERAPEGGLLARLELPQAPTG